MPDINMWVCPCFEFAGNLNDLHMFEPANASWTDLSIPASGTPPSRRNAHGVAALGSKLYVMGGGSELDCIFQYCYGSASFESPFFFLA
jgi:hypothetical protein